MERRADFCINCRKETAYELQQIPIRRHIRDKEYEFLVTAAICKECGEEMSIPGLMDQNIREIDAQYRAAENIVSTNDIQKLMAMYNIGKSTLSLALGFGEVTITRYLDGQVPSKEYSDIIRQALSSADYMEKMLNQNREKVGETAYNKSLTAVKNLKALYRTVSPKLLSVISYVFSELKEVTPLMLQKLLYYIQGIYYTLYDILIFEERCEAWVHGPVYRNVYTLFKDFKYNPIDDVRFSLLKGWEDNLTQNEKEIIELVLNTFGLYSGKALERITHKEYPWKEARSGYANYGHSNEEISLVSMKKYFNEVAKTFDIRTEEGWKKYISKMMWA